MSSALVENFQNAMEAGRAGCVFGRRRLKCSHEDKHAHWVLDLNF